MAKQEKYVVIRDNKIVSPVYEWDGMTAWSPPEMERPEGDGSMLVRLAEARSMGITEKDLDEDVTPDINRKAE